MENRAMLLPTIHSDLMHYARGLFAAKGMQNPLEIKSISSRSVLSEITAKFQHHVTYRPWRIGWHNLGENRSSENQELCWKNR